MQGLVVAWRHSLKPPKHPAEVSALGEPTLSSDFLDWEFSQHQKVAGVLHSPVVDGVRQAHPVRVSIEPSQVIGTASQLVRNR
jgi:hypothetical protein